VFLILINVYLGTLHVTNNNCRIQQPGVPALNLEYTEYGSCVEQSWVP